MEKITITFEEFTEAFPELDATEKLFNSSLSSIPVYITTTAGEIDLPPEIHKRGVLLAGAHIIFLKKNPDAVKQVASATEGGVSATFNLYAGGSNNAKYYSLACSPYGMELLIILKSIQPPMPDKPDTSGIYYPAKKGLW